MSATIPSGLPSHAEWRAYAAARVAFDRAPSESTMAGVLDAWDAWDEAFMGANDPDRPRRRAAVVTGLATNLPARAA